MNAETDRIVNFVEWRPWLDHIPERRSSRLFRPEPNGITATDGNRGPCYSASTSEFNQARITPRGRSTSPVRASPRRPIQSRTFVPRSLPADLQKSPNLSHSRVQLQIRLTAPVFVGGATVEGEISITFDTQTSIKRQQRLPDLSLRRVTATLLGLERCKERVDFFQALSTYVFSASEETVDTGTDLPFFIDLPINVGPPPFKTSKFEIKYLLMCTAQFEIEGKTYVVRRCIETPVLPVHDRKSASSELYAVSLSRELAEKALVNLVEPLVVSDQLNHGLKTVILAAGIHRQTWIAGYPMFVDVKVVNTRQRRIRKLKIQLERVIVIFHHTPPSAYETGTTKFLRIPDDTERSVIAKKTFRDLNISTTPPHEDVRTLQLDIPNNMVSIETGRYFGLRYFLSIEVTMALGKRIKVQLPVTLIHPNSIDIPPNVLAQVTASIERKFCRSRISEEPYPPYRYRPGRPFSAARQRSCIQLRNNATGSDEIESLSRALLAVPRLHDPLNMDVLPDNADIRGSDAKIEAFSGRQRIIHSHSAVPLSSNTDFSSYHRSPIPTVRRLKSQTSTLLPSPIKTRNVKSFRAVRRKPSAARKSLNMGSEHQTQPQHVRNQSRKSLESCPLSSSERLGRSDLERSVLTHLRMSSTGDLNDSNADQKPAQRQELARASSRAGHASSRELPSHQSRRKVKDSSMLHYLPWPSLQQSNSGLGFDGGNEDEEDIELRGHDLRSSKPSGHTDSDKENQDPSKVKQEGWEHFYGIYL